MRNSATLVVSTSGPRDVTHRDGDGLTLTDEDDEALAAGDAGVEQITCRGTDSDTGLAADQLEKVFEPFSDSKYGYIRPIPVRRMSPTILVVIRHALRGEGLHVLQRT